MSIVITVVSKNGIVQVSDVRLSSLKDGEPLPQLQRKSMLVLGSTQFSSLDGRGSPRLEAETASSTLAIGCFEL